MEEHERLSSLKRTFYASTGYWPEWVENLKCLSAPKAVVEAWNCMAGGPSSLGCGFLGDYRVVCEEDVGEMLRSKMQAEKAGGAEQSTTPVGRCLDVAYHTLRKITVGEMRALPVGMQKAVWHLLIELEVRARGMKP